MRVLHVYKTYFPETCGGVEEAIRQICRSTGSLGVSNELFTLADEPDKPGMEQEEVKVWRYKRWTQIRSCDIPGFTGIRQFRKHARKCDLIHYHYPWPFSDLLHLINAIPARSIVTYHSDIVRQWVLSYPYAPIMRRFLSSVDLIVATSPNYVLKSPVLRKYKRKVAVIPLGLDPTPAKDSSPDLLRFWERQVGRDFFLFIGTLRYYKGLPFLIEAARGTRLQVIIVGTGPEESYLKQLARGMANIRFVGSVSDDDKFALLQLARCLALPSHLRSEAFGIVLLEAARFGKPLITAEIGSGTSFVNVTNETGFVVPPANPLELRRAMEILAGDDNMVKEMGSSSRRRFDSMFTSEQMAEEYVRLYQRLLDGHPRTY
ncbi:MAG: glycosyltransferase [Desulfomonilaceae bacterium]